MEMHYPTAEETLVLHAETMGLPSLQALDNVRDLGLLESALARPRNAATGEDASLVEQAATLMWGLIRNHPFVDGNKRTAYVVTQTFLRSNGATIEASEDEIFEFVVSIAEGMGLEDAEAGLDRLVSSWPVNITRAQVGAEI